MSNSFDDRRSHPRLPIKLPVEYKSLSDFFVDYALDISHGGMFVATGQAFELGTPVSVRFNLPDDPASFEATGVIVRHGKAPQPGVGISFDPLSQNAKAVIERLWERKMKE